MIDESIRAAYLRNLWRWATGEPEYPVATRMEVDSEVLRVTEWSFEFERLMRNRLHLGAYRYGRINAPGKARYDRVTSIIKRLVKYRKTGNVDLLVDASTLSLLEFEEGDHPLRHLDGAAHDETVKRR